MDYYSSLMEPAHDRNRFQNFMLKNDFKTYNKSAS